MSENSQKSRARLDELNEALNSGAFIQIRRMLNSLPPAEVAHLIESTPPKMRAALWQLIDLEGEGDVLQYLSDEVQSQFLQAMDTEEVVAITEGMDTDDVADILQQLPDQVIQEVLASMDQQDRLRVEQVLPYGEDTAGGLMDTDTITVRPNITMDVVLRYLRRHETLPEMTDHLMVVNRNDQLIGLLPLRRVLVSDTSMTVREVMTTEVQPIEADTPALVVAKLFERNDWVSHPVVDGGGHLIWIP